MIPWLTAESAFPPVSSAQTAPNGLLAAGADLSPARLLDAYRSGIFPWYLAGQPILWWSPDPRMVVFPEEFVPSRSLAKTLRNTVFEIRFDTVFRDVMLACAAPRNGHDGTWIVDDIIDAYSRMHELGHAHSVETWCDGELVGGLYGLAIGRMFYGESMFSRATDASKVAFAHLVAYLRSANFGMIDCQMSTPHLASLGAREIPREDFCARVAELINYPAIPEKWTYRSQNPDGPA